MRKIAIIIAALALVALTASFAPHQFALSDACLDFTVAPDSRGKEFTSG